MLEFLEELSTSGKLYAGCEMLKRWAPDTRMRVTKLGLRGLRWPLHEANLQSV